MQVLYERCCGLDIHKKVIVACRLLVTDGHLQRDIERFGTTYQELRHLETWLLQAKCTHIAMESTGVYWHPIYNVLEESFEHLMIVNAQHIKAVPGRKTDIKDAQWIAELLQHGLLSPSFIPPRPQRDLRELTRGRKQLIGERSRIVNRIQKVLEDTNIKLASVVSNITGKSATKMLDALLEGVQDVKAIAALAHHRLKASPEELEKALEGNLREHHRFLLRQALHHLKDLDQQIVEFDAEIARRIQANLEPDPPDGKTMPPSQTQEKSEPETQEQQEHDTHRYQKAVEQLDSIPGISTKLAEVLIAEIGIDMSRFPDERHLASWAGVCPGNKISAGKRLSGQTKKGNRYVRDALIEAARAASKSKGTFVGAFYRRLKGRIGSKRATMALAHRLLVIIYHLLKKEEMYQEYGEQATNEQAEEARKRHAIHQLEKMGYQVELQQAESA
jgi:transposase